MWRKISGIWNLEEPLLIRGLVVLLVFLRTCVLRSLCMPIISWLLVFPSSEINVASKDTSSSSSSSLYYRVTIFQSFLVWATSWKWDRIFLKSGEKRGKKEQIMKFPTNMLNYSSAIALHPEMRKFIFEKDKKERQTKRKCSCGLTKVPRLFIFLLGLLD